MDQKYDPPAQEIYQDLDPLLELEAAEETAVAISTAEAAPTIPIPPRHAGLVSHAGWRAAGTPAPTAGDGQSPITGPQALIEPIDAILAGIETLRGEGQTPSPADPQPLLERIREGALYLRRLIESSE